MVDLGEEPTFEVLTDHLWMLFHVEKEGKETIEMMNKTEIVKASRQLRHWYIILIGTESRTTKHENLMVGASGWIPLMQHDLVLSWISCT